MRSSGRRTERVLALPEPKPTTRTCCATPPGGAEHHIHIGGKPDVSVT